MPSVQLINVPIRPLSRFNLLHRVTCPLSFTSNCQIPSSDPPSVLAVLFHFGPWRHLLKLSKVSNSQVLSSRGNGTLSVPSEFVPPLTPPRISRVVHTSWSRYPTSTFHAHYTIDVVGHALPPFTAPSPQALFAQLFDPRSMMTTPNMISVASE